MQLSDALLASVVASLKAAGESGEASKRREDRTPLVGRAVIVPCGAHTGRKPTNVGVRDLSPSGIGIVHTSELQTGERFVLLLPRGASKVASGVLCSVANCRRAAGGSFLIGATYIALVRANQPPRPLESHLNAVPEPTSLPVKDLLAAFRKQAENVLKPEELTLLHEIERRLAQPKPAEVSPTVLGAPRVKADVVPAAAPAPPASDARSDKRGPAEIRPLLTRDECLQRAEKAMQARTLSGVVAQVITLAASPRGDMSELAALVSRDPILSARILQAANSVSYMSTRGIVSTVAEAVRNIGCATVRDIAAALGVFDAMPPSGPDGFNPIRCWQHSFAAATLCQRLAPEADGGPAYLVGLCHDLGEILFHTHFAAEYQQVIEAQQASGKRRDEVERVMLGMTHGELVQTILRCLKLPDAIREPIEDHHRTGVVGRPETALGRVLRLADLYANGVLLASSTHSPVAPLSRPECRAAAGAENPPRPDGLALRGEIFGLTAMLARLSPKEDAALMTPPYAHRPQRLCLVRDPSLSSFDPIEAALESMAELQVRNAMPSAEQLNGFEGVVVVARSTSAAGFTSHEVTAAARIRPALWLTGRVDEGSVPPNSAAPIAWPVPLNRLAEFVEQICADAQPQPRSNAA